MAPPSGCNLICKNPPLPAQYNQSEPRGVSEKCQSFSCIHCWQPPSLTQCALGSAPPPHRCSACSYLVRYFQAQTLQSHKMPHHCRDMPSKRRNKKTDEEKQCKEEELDQAREKTRINIRASFQRWRELQDL